MRDVKKVIGVAILLGLLVGVYVIGSQEEGRYITLRATFKMGGAVYKGYELEGEVLVFKFERSGDFFTQAIETKEFTTGEKLSPKKVIMEVNTNGEVKRYEAKLIEEKGDVVIYEASEL
ncbi:hypothetical protein [Thermococcus sp. 2319x1]|uniref:hypothetical protein n=1 Tax=Thermococcus sp. 2319x1 TaxID=1674923 RepID=UPI001EEFF939|nr:hypothetical protein [Thermococcus sp. 2319x1]